MNTTQIEINEIARKAFWKKIHEGEMENSWDAAYTAAQQAGANDLVSQSAANFASDTY